MVKYINQSIPCDEKKKAKTPDGLVDINPIMIKEITEENKKRGRIDMSNNVPNERKQCQLFPNTSR